MHQLALKIRPEEEPYDYLAELLKPPAERRPQPQDPEHVDLRLVEKKYRPYRGLRGFSYPIVLGRGFIITVNLGGGKSIVVGRHIDWGQHTPMVGVGNPRRWYQWTEPVN